MLLQTSLEQQIENLATIASISMSKKGEGFSDANDLIKNYRRFISVHYARYLPAQDQTPDLLSRLVTDLAECSKISEIFMGGTASQIDDLNQSSAIEFDAVIGEQSRKKEIMEGGISLLKEISVDHYSMLHLLITDIVILPSKIAYGGSTSDGLGIVWANPNANWRAADAAEFLVHELTHHCMFVDEICNAHYDYELILKEENWAQSAILKKIRPVDKVLHSIVVCTEILLFRERIGHPASCRAHPPTTKLFQQIESSISSLKELNKKNSEILTPRAREILLNCENQVVAIESICELEA